ncbi:MAG TPA: glycoside hydrolase family 97 catalytic domain-containing protein [Edaphobacter sp.]|nr:glycoside hydrolase family 97 catalytic domain-containing protein [Edaphobacter sp.]
MMKARSTILVFFAAIAATVAPFAGQTRGRHPVTISSPDGRTRAELNAADGILSYRVLLDGKQVLAPSMIGIEADDVELGQGVTLGSAKTRKVDERYRFFGAHAEAVNRANEATIPAQSHGQSYLVDVHVANDGVGVRLRLPAKAGRRVQADRSSWMIEGDPTVWAAKLNNSYESAYHQTTLKQLGTGNIGFPLTARIGQVYIALTEALVKDYGDLAVKVGESGALEGQLYADPKGWTTDKEVVQPWRVTIVARNLTGLVNTTFVENLNPPASAELVKADWIKPGRSAWQWLASGDPKESEQQRWIDWTSQLKFEYYLIDEGWEKWPDSWQAIASDVAYAKTKNVKIWIWVHSRTVLDPQARREYMRKAVEAGVVGIKIDFPPPASREIANWYFDTAKDAADMHLMVDFHGSNKPTGMDRTWPNVITREAVRGHEYQITRYHRVPQPDHDVILPFTRYVAGPGDYTPTVFTTSELMGNTWAHELAQAVIFTSPFLCFGGHPQSYLENPARDVLTAISPVWDETRVFAGSEPGKVVAEARRSGKQWFIAVINGGEATTLDIPLTFLGSGSWESTQLRDAKDKPDAWNREDGKATRNDHIRLEIAARGGFVGWIHQ